MYETRGESKFYYSYDANGTLYSVKYTLTDSSDLMTYYFTHNSRGDIVGIYNGAGQLRAHYEYDAWGNVLSVTDQNGNAITSATHIGNLNPFRYRGYYLDTETGLYYLMSRYYDPVTHRFVNADGYFQSGGDVLDSNMSAYCRNNPISFVDPTGEYTWKQMQIDISTGNSDYDITYVTKAQRMGLAENDEFFITNDGYIYTYSNVFYAINKSVHISAGAGFGIGHGIQIFGPIKIETYFKMNLVQIDMTPSGDFYGGTGCSTGAGIPFLSWDNSAFRMNGTLYATDNNTIPNTFSILSHNDYKLLGYSVDVYVNLDEFNKALRGLI